MLAMLILSSLWRHIALLYFTSIQPLKSLVWIATEVKVPLGKQVPVQSTKDKSHVRPTCFIH